MKRTLSLALAAVTALGALFGCGGGHHTTASVKSGTTARSTVPCPPPAGEGFMGACVPRPVQVYPGGLRFPALTVIAGPKFPDVSSWQGNVNWATVRAWQHAHGWKGAGIFKMGEYVSDPYAARNNSQLRVLGMWRAGYWFVRNTGCTHEAGQIIAEARALGLRVVVEDDEVPEARGYDACLTPALRAAGLIVVEYSSPGAYPGGNGGPGNPTWIAAFGPASHPASPWGTRVVAFQCSDGIYGCVTDVPGIGRDDVSIDLGITSLGAAPPKPPGPSQAQIRRWQGARNASFRHYRARSCSNGLDAGCQVFAQRVVYFQRRLWTAYPRWHCFGPHARKGTYVCWITRPEVSRWSKARDSSRRAFLRYRGGVCAKQFGTTPRQCAVFQQRVRYFGALVKANLY